MLWQAHTSKEEFFKVYEEAKNRNSGKTSTDVDDILDDGAGYSEDDTKNNVHMSLNNFHKTMIYPLYSILVHK